MAAKTPHGLVIVNTGDGKGKTTAALGMAMRAAGHDQRVAFVQFIKAWSVGEHEAASRLGIEIFRMGRGFVIGEPTPEHRQAAPRPWSSSADASVKGSTGWSWPTKS